MNCWEATKCGKEEHCAAYHAVSLDGFLGGKNGGKACFFILGTRCKGGFQDTKEAKEATCNTCDFFHSLKKQYGELISNEQIRNYLRSKFVNTLFK
ncbi:MAG: hypothetical protein D6732_11615 [Methanobacteriota archaeon]|nr:MAG: hypothetical protein D6732_11615 [Euryarchaeota archaeon]